MHPIPVHKTLMATFLPRVSATMMTVMATHTVSRIM